MRTVKIAELKARLSAHLRFVRQGEEVLVCDRNEPVARIVPVRREDQLEQEKRLIARGVLVPPLKRRPAKDKWPKPAGRVKISDEVMKRIWDEEREDRF